MKKKNAKIKDISSDRIMELLELHTTTGASKILGCSQGGLQYQMKQRGITSPHYRSPRHRENLSMSKIRQYGYTNADELIDMIKKLGDQLGRRPTQKDLSSQNNMPSKEVFGRMFGSWSNALEIAGFDPTIQPNRKRKERPRGKKAARKKKREVTGLEDRIYKNMTPRLRYAVLARDKFRCMYCGRNPKEDGIKLQVDHIVPASKGGQNTYHNLVSCCRECNQGKHNHYQLAPPGASTRIKIKTMKG